MFGGFGYAPTPGGSNVKTWILSANPTSEEASFRTRTNSKYAKECSLQDL